MRIISGEMIPDWHWFVRVGSGLFGLVRVGSDWIGLVRVRSDWFGFVRIGSDWFGFVRIGSDWFGLAQGPATPSDFKPTPTIFRANPSQPEPTRTNPTDFSPPG